MTAVSVIIPVYNAEKYLSRCLDSVVQQTLKDIEIICVDDGSTDRTSTILENYRSKFPQIKIIKQENQGQSVARNVAMEAAQGEYIGFVDGDDWVPLDFFEKLYQTAQKYDADAACSGIKRPHSDGRNRTKLSFEKEEILTSASSKFEKLDLPRQCYLWNKIFRKSVVEKLDLKFPVGKIFEDIYFSIRFFYYSNQIVLVPNLYYNYWSYGNSTLGNMTDKRQQDLIEARADFIKFAHEHHIIRPEKYYIKEKISYKFFGILFLRIHRWETIDKYYLFGIIPFFEKRRAL